MAYWSYHGAGGMTSTIDTILDKESFELNELLADEELLQECKALNSRLIAYLSKPEVIEQLFTYIMVEPTAEDTNERCYTCVAVFCPRHSTRPPQSARSRPQACARRRWWPSVRVVRTRRPELTLAGGPA